VIRALVDVGGEPPFQPTSAVVEFEALPQVGECLEMPLSMLGINELTSPHPEKFAWPNGRGGDFGVSLTVRSIYWQADGDRKVMMPVLNVDMSHPGLWEKR
jgi:hypothetical protein